LGVLERPYILKNELIESVGSCLFSCPLRSLLRSIER
jgi:hypothetical protein